MEAFCLSCLATVVCDPLRQALGDFLQRTADSLLTYLSGRASAVWDAFSRLRNPVEAVPLPPAITGESGSTGKKGYMISARDLTIAHGSNDLYWRWTTRPDSRFPEVAELLKVWWLEITGEVDVRELSPGTHYAAHLVFALCEQTEGLSYYQEASITVGGQDYSKCRVCLAPKAPGSSELPLGSPDKLVKLPRRRDDGWMEMELGEFSVDQGSLRGVVRMKVKDVHDALKKSGLIVAGTEVRPKSFALDGSTGKKGYMISARDLTIAHGSNDLYWQWISRPDSRFPEVAELLKVWWFEITGDVDVRELSPGTHYTAHLVFALCEKTEGLSHYQEASITVGGQDYSKCRVCLAPEAPGSSELPLGSPENLLRLPRRRDDGWMEMEVGEFFVDQGSLQGVVRIKVKDVDDALKKSGLIVAGMEVRPKGSR